MSFEYSTRTRELQQRLSGEIELSVEESYPPGKYTLLEG